MDLATADRTGARPPALNAYRVAVAALAWLAIAVQYVVFMGMLARLPPLDRTIDFFSFFTIVSNILLALAMTLPWLAPRAAATRFVLRTDVRTAIATYMIVTGVVYVLLLRRLWSPQGLSFAADVALHYALPVLFLIDWLFLPKAAPRWRAVVETLALPLAYAVWTFVHGMATGFYPYPFLNAERIGYVWVVVNMLALGVMFALLCAGLTALKAVVGPEP